MPVDEASTVHTTLSSAANTASEVDSKDQWIIITLPDIVTPTDGIDIPLSEDVTDHLNIAAGYLYIDETDVGGDAEVIVYCDEDADGIPEATENILKRTGDGFNVTLGNDAVAEACDFLRIDLNNYDAASESVDIYLTLQIDSTTG